MALNTRMRWGCSDAQGLPGLFAGRKEGPARSQASGCRYVCFPVGTAVWSHLGPFPCTLR